MGAGDRNDPEERGMVQVGAHAVRLAAKTASSVDSGVEMLLTENQEEDLSRNMQVR